MKIGTCRPGGGRPVALRDLHGGPGLADGREKVQFLVQVEMQGPAVQAGALRQDRKTLVISAKVLKFLGQGEQDPCMGARGLRRAAQRRLELGYVVVGFRLAAKPGAEEQRVRVGGLEREAALARGASCLQVAERKLEVGQAQVQRSGLGLDRDGTLLGTPRRVELLQTMQHLAQRGEEPGVAHLHGQQHRPQRNSAATLP